MWKKNIHISTRWLIGYLLLSLQDGKTRSMPRNTKLTFHIPNAADTRYEAPRVIFYNLTRIIVSIVEWLWLLPWLKRESELHFFARKVINCKHCQNCVSYHHFLFCSLSYCILQNFFQHIWRKWKFLRKQLWRQGYLSLCLLRSFVWLFVWVSLGGGGWSRCFPSSKKCIWNVCNHLIQALSV